MIEFGPSRRIVGLLVAVVLLLAGAPAQSQVDPAVFTVSHIPVDATADDAVSARREALLEGQRAGLETLLRRLVPAEEHARLPPVASLPVERYVQNFSISNEEVSSRRYLAELTVAYDPDAVRELLRAEGLSFAQARSEPLLVLPLYQGPEDEAARLWADDNPWWQAWAETLDSERLLRLVLPLGDLEDMATVDAAAARAGEREALLRLAERYGGSDVLVATARVGTDPESGVPEVRLDARRVGEIERTGEPLTLRAAPEQSQEDLLEEAVRRLQASLDERWKSRNLLRFDQAGLMVVDVPINRLEEWVRIRRGLANLSEVSQVEIEAFAREKVRAQIRFIGDEARLEDGLRRLGLTVSREGETWQLRPTGGSPGPGAPQSATSRSSSPARR